MAPRCCPRILSFSIMAVAMATSNRRMNIYAVNHLGSGHQYTPMREHVTCMVAIDTGNGQRRGADNNAVACPTCQRKHAYKAEEVNSYVNLLY